MVEASSARSSVFSFPLFVVLAWCGCTSHFPLSMQIFLCAFDCMDVLVVSMECFGTLEQLVVGMLHEFGLD